MRDTKSEDELTFERWLEGYERFAPVLQRAQSIGMQGGLGGTASADATMAGGKPNIGKNKGGRPPGSGAKAKAGTGGGQATGATGATIATT